MEAPQRGRYRALPLIATPLEQDGHKRYQGTPSERSLDQESNLKGTPSEGSLDQERGLRGTPSEGSLDQQKDFKPGGHVGETAVIHRNKPAFRHKNEASTIELFYDLFFVANLTSFTNVHTIDDRTTISSYVGFFAILWFTWLQVVLYDVRFGVDSVFERVCKLIHFGVMVSYAIVGPNFDPSNIADNYGTFRQLSLILVISRILLIIQYGSVLFWIKGHKDAITPILIQIAIFVVGAAVSLGLLFSFNSDTSGRPYLGWYAIATFEAVVVFLSSSQWRVVSFKRTNLNERCGLLTLIILGEGIIVLTKAMNNVVKGENFSSAIIAQIVSAVFIIYFVYMLYFDQVDNKRFGTIRQQFWALAHFPFHISLVLLMEGTARFITWRNAIELVDRIIFHFDDIYSSSNNTAVLASEFSDFSRSLLQTVEADLVKYNVTQYIYDLRAESRWDTEEAYVAVDNIFGTLINATFKYFKIQASKKDESLTSKDHTIKPDPLRELYNVLKVYDLVFIYFFVAAGLTVVMMAVLIALAKKGKCAGDYAAIILRLVVGSGLAMISIVTVNAAAQQNYLYSAWMLPSVLLGLFVVVVLDGIFGWVLPAPSMVSRTNSYDSQKDYGHA